MSEKNWINDPPMQRTVLGTVEECVLCVFSVRLGSALTISAKRFQQWSFDVFRRASIENAQHWNRMLLLMRPYTYFVNVGMSLNVESTLVRQPSTGGQLVAECPHTWYACASSASLRLYTCDFIAAGKSASSLQGCWALQIDSTNRGER